MGVCGSDMDKTDVEFYGELKHETKPGTDDGAYLVFDGANEVWLPKSQVVEMELLKKPTEYKFVIPEWLAKEKGII